jgi:hypothetical protein
MWNSNPCEETILNGLPVKISSYQVGNGFVTEIEESERGRVIVRGIAKSSGESFVQALDAFSRRVSYFECFDLTVGG